MSERDPSAKNAVNVTLNNDISENGLTVVNMSSTTSIYSHCSENSRNCVHLYAPELTRAFDMSHASTTDGTRTRKPMTEIFITNFQDEDTEFPTTNSPPTTHNPLETTILAQAQTTSRPTHADTFNHTTNNTSDTLETTILAQTRTQTKSALRHPATKNYAATDIMKNKTTPFSILHRFSNSKTAAPTSCNPFYFIPISEKVHKLCPTLIVSDNYETSSTKCDTSRIYQDLDIVRILTPYLFDRHPHSPLHLKHLNHYSHTSAAPTAPTTAYLQQQA
jgi:hypothetical protein